MKRIIIIVIALAVATLVTAEDKFWTGLTEIRRYDLADAYNEVADHFEDLGQNERAERFRALTQDIFPGYEPGERTMEMEKSVTVSRSVTPMPNMKEAVRYHFAKLLWGVFNEDLPLTLSALADTIYVPLHDEGIKKRRVESELTWFFENYELDSVLPEEVFLWDSITIVPLDNGYWCLNVEIAEPYVDAVPNVTFWDKRQGYYFHPEGWRLVAVGRPG